MKNIIIEFTKDDNFWYKKVMTENNEVIIDDKLVWFDEFNNKEYFDGWENQLKYVLSNRYTIVEVRRFI